MATIIVIIILLVSVGCFGYCLGYRFGMMWGIKFFKAILSNASDEPPTEEEKPWDI